MTHAPELILAENEFFIAAIEENPLVLGHCVVYPKRAEDAFMDLSNEEISGIMVFAKTIAKAIQKTVPCRKIGIAALGLQVRHAHLHVVPINTADDLNFTRARQTVTKEQLIQTIQLIKVNL